MVHFYYLVLLSFSHCASFSLSPIVPHFHCLPLCLVFIVSHCASFSDSHCSLFHSLWPLLFWNTNSQLWNNCLKQLYLCASCCELLSWHYTLPLNKWLNKCYVSSIVCNWLLYKWWEDWRRSCCGKCEMWLMIRMNRHRNSHWILEHSIIPRQKLIYQLQGSWCTTKYVCSCHNEWNVQDVQSAVEI